MKRIILLALFLLLPAVQTWAQWKHNKADFPYKPAATFNGDTAAYLEYNYLIRNIQYVGRTVGEILKELEFPVLYIVEYGMQTSGTPKLISLCLSIRQVGKQPEVHQDYYIAVNFETPPVLDKFREAGGVGSKPVFTPKLYDFIKDLKVLSVGSSDFIIKDPEILERVKSIQEENYRRGRQAQEELDRRKRNQQ